MKYLDYTKTIEYLSTRWPQFIFRPHTEKVKQFVVDVDPPIDDHLKGITYTYVVVDPIDDGFINRALMILPTFFSLHRITVEDAKPFVEGTHDWEGFLFPCSSHLRMVILLDGDKRKCKYNGGASGNGCSVAVRGGDSILTLGVRVWHELLHTLQLPADDMLVDVGFTKWLPDPVDDLFVQYKEKLQHNPHIQMLYYTYLMERLG